MKTIKILKRICLILAVIMATTMSADAQFKGLGKKLKNAAKNTVERNINSTISKGERAVDRSLDKAADASANAVNKKIQEKKNKKASEQQQENNATTTTTTTTVATETTTTQKANTLPDDPFAPKDEYTRVIPDDQWDPETFYSSDIRPIEHADWNASTSNGRLKEHLAFMLAEQIRNINTGNWEGVAASFRTRNADIWKVVTEMEKRKMDTRYATHQMHELCKTQRDVLYPGLHVCDRQGYSLEWATGNYDFTVPMTKYRFYDILNYYIEMGKRETSDILRHTTTCEVIYWRADGVMHPEMFKEDPLFVDDPQWVAGDQELTKLCEAAGISGFQSFENITAYRKKLEAQRLEKEAKWNTANRIPKSSLNDANAIAFAKKEFPVIMGSDIVVVKVFVKSKWNVATNAFGVPINREKTMSVIAKHPDGYYRLHDCRMSSITSNGGRSWSNSMFSIDAVAGNREGYVVNWK